MLAERASYNGGDAAPARPPRMKAVALRLVGLLLIATALALALSRAPDRAVETLVARWALPPSQFVDLDGQLVHLRDEGPRSDPLPVVLIHGTASSLHTWDGWAAALRSHRRVIRFDLPGFGLTGPRADADYRPQADARFVLALLDHLQLRRFVAAGNSLGGEVAVQLASLAPARVERLILVDAAGLGHAPRALALGWHMARVPVLNRLPEHLLPRALVAAGLARAYGDPARVTPELVDRHFELTLREGNRRALVQRLQQRPQPPDDAGHEAVLRTLHQPTLILWGARDRLLPPAIGRRYAAAIGGSTWIQFDQLGHLPHEEDPQRSVQPVLEFLASP